MQDKLEDFIKDNKAAFDTAEPDNRVWNKVNHALDHNKVKTINSSVWYWRAAVAVLLIAVVYLAADKFSASQPKVAALSTLQEFEQLETFYTSMITEKKMELSEQVSDEEYFSYLEADIQSLDDLYRELKVTFEEGQETPQVKSALVHLLRQKLHLINKQLDIMEQLKDPKATDSASGTSSL
jgi:hypothetical protein